MRCNGVQPDVYKDFPVKGVNVYSSSTKLRYRNTARRFPCIDQGRKVGQNQPGKGATTEGNPETDYQADEYPECKQPVTMLHHTDNFVNFVAQELHLFQKSSSGGFVAYLPWMHPRETWSVNVRENGVLWTCGECEQWIDFDCSMCLFLSSVKCSLDRYGLCERRIYILCFGITTSFPARDSRTMHGISSWLFLTWGFSWEENLFCELEGPDEKIVFAKVEESQGHGNWVCVLPVGFSWYLTGAKVETSGIVLCSEEIRYALLIWRVIFIFFPSNGDCFLLQNLLACFPAESDQRGKAKHWMKIVL